MEPCAGSALGKPQLMFYVPEIPLENFGTQKYLGPLAPSLHFDEFRFGKKLEVMRHGRRPDIVLFAQR